MPPQVELTTFDRKVLNYIYKYPGQTVKAIQIDFDSKYGVTQSLRRLARQKKITVINFQIHPVCSQVS